MGPLLRTKCSESVSFYLPPIDMEPDVGGSPGLDHFPLKGTGPLSGSMSLSLFFEGSDHLLRNVKSVWRAQRLPFNPAGGSICSSRRFRPTKVPQAPKARFMISTRGDQKPPSSCGVAGGQRDMHSEGSATNSL